MLVIGVSIFFIPTSSVSMDAILTDIIDGFFIGIFSHLFLDSLTVSGIPLLYPFSKKKYKLLRLKTNKHELLSQIIVFIPTLIFVIYYYSSFLK